MFKLIIPEHLKLEFFHQNLSPQLQLYWTCFHCHAVLLWQIANLMHRKRLKCHKYLSSLTLKFRLIHSYQLTSRPQWTVFYLLISFPEKRVFVNYIGILIGWGAQKQPRLSLFLDSQFYSISSFKLSIYRFLLVKSHWILKSWLSPLLRNSIRWQNHKL